MTERLLQFIWQFQYFNKSELLTTDGETVQILHHGKFNLNQGPDFLDAKVIIGHTTWAGNIEIHINTSDWNRHRHTGDDNYANVILHVVWKHDKNSYNVNEPLIPVLVLQPLVATILLDRYRQLMIKKTFVPCENYLPVYDALKWTNWKQRLAVERLQRKAQAVQLLLQQNNNNWEETFWWLLARNFGIKVNADIFENIARSIPVNILAKHKNQLHQIECLLMGQAGLLQDEFTDDYPILLKKEYAFYQKKYQLKQPLLKPYFLRMRPANFPTVRLAQLAVLVYQSVHLFSKVKEAKQITDIKTLLNVTANDYWHYHYKFDESAEYLPKQLGNQMVENIIINTVVPIIFSYGQLHKDELLKDKALQFLEQISAEKNTITEKWKKFGVENKSAVDSQALIELKNNYCDKLDCLQCAIGNHILRSN